MKYRIRISWVLVLIVLAGCQPNRYIHDILEDQVQRGQLYHEILMNETYRAHLMDSIQNNNKTKMLIKTSAGDYWKERRN